MIYSIDWLVDRIDQGETFKYVFFWGHSNNLSEEAGKFIFSQWYLSPFTVDSIEYKTAEHWMMAKKAILFGDVDVADKILRATKPGEVKELGRQIKNFNETVWDRHKYEIVKTGNLNKFDQNKKLKDYLISTGERILVEASPVDKIWGIGLAQDSKLINHPHEWKGQNLLGFALMEVRDSFKS